MLLEVFQKHLRHYEGGLFESVEFLDIVSVQVTAPYNKVVHT